MRNDIDGLLRSVRKEKLRKVGTAELWKFKTLKKFYLFFQQKVEFKDETNRDKIPPKFMTRLYENVARD